MDKLQLLVKGLITNLLFTTLLFVCAGRMDYTQGWIFLLANLFATFSNFLTIRKNVDLMHERSSMGEGAKPWDKKILKWSAVLYFLLILISGIDSGRFQWTSFHKMISIAGVVVMLLGQLLFLTARKENIFFSSVVRIQRERGHVVCETGLYRVVRHPGYLGMIFSWIGIPMITTSIWGTLPTVIAIFLLVLRTSFEDRTLKSELDGYADYCRKTRYKLLPYVW